MTQGVRQVFAFRIVRSMGVAGRSAVYYRSLDARDAGARRFADRDGRPVTAQFFTDDHWFTVAAFSPTTARGL